MKIAADDTLRVVKFLQQSEWCSK